MDVTFTNVLEGARQYFQGLPAATGSTASPATATYPPAPGEAVHHNPGHGSDQQASERASSAVTTYWPPPENQQQGGESTTPSQTPPRTPQQAERTSVQVPSDQNHQGYYGVPSSTAAAAAHQQQQYNFQRPQSQREVATNVPSSHHPAQYHVPNQHTSQHYHQMQPPAQGRPASRPHEQPPGHHGQSYHQMQPPRTAHVSQGYQNLYQHPHQNQQTSASYSNISQNYPTRTDQQTASQHNHNYTHNSHNPQQQPYPQTSSSSSSSGQGHSNHGHVPPQQPQHHYNPETYTSQPQTQTPASRNDNQYTTVTSQRSRESATSNDNETAPTSQSQAHRTTHNLPPIAALSVNYQSNRSTAQRFTNHSRQRTSTVASTPSNSGSNMKSNGATLSVPSSSSSASSSVQSQQQDVSSVRQPQPHSQSYSMPSNNTQSSEPSYNYSNVNGMASMPRSSSSVNSSSSYPQAQYPYTSNPSYSYPAAQTANTTMPSTSSSTSSSYAQSSNATTHFPIQSRVAQQQQQQQQQDLRLIHSTSSSKPPHNYPPIQGNHAATNLSRQDNSMARTVPVIKQKRESPLDLSVKTVRTPADSTLDDTTEVHSTDARLGKMYMPSRTMPPPRQPQAQVANYPTYDVHANAFQRTMNPRPTTVPSTGAPKVDFLPNFNVSSNANHSRGSGNYATTIDNRRTTTTAMQQQNQQQIPSYPHRAAYDKKAQQQYPTQHNAQYSTNSSQLPQSRHPPSISSMPPTTSHMNNSYAMSQPATKKPSEGLPRIDFPAPGLGHKTSAMYPVPPRDPHRKRTADPAPAPIPNKVPKYGADSWRQSIDQQIEQRLSTYANSRMHEQQIKHQVNPAAKPPVLNGNTTHPGTYPQRPHENYANSYQKAQYQNSSQAYNQFHRPPTMNHNQTYIPSAIAHQQYPNQMSHQHEAYGQLTARSNSLSKLNLAASNKHHIGAAADKRVLSILRNSLEIKGAKEAQKKLEQEQLRPLELPVHRPEVQHPSTDVTAPLQPKLGIVGRHNVSPFTAASLLERNSNTPPYKFHVPRAIDSVRYDSEAAAKNNTKLEDNIMNFGSSDLDGLAAFLAARIRTKAELKQVGPSHGQVNNNTSTSPSSLSNAVEPQMPIKVLDEGQTLVPGVNISPPKLKREPPPFPPRRRLFSRSEEEPTVSTGTTTNSASLPPRDKSLRSSSETSVFDFPDTDSEGEMPVLERQSLDDMRRDRKSLPKPEIKVEEIPPMEDDSVIDPFWADTCDKFMEELRTGGGKKRGRRKKMVEQESVLKDDFEFSEEPLLADVHIKVEKPDEEAEPMDDTSSVPFMDAEVKMEIMEKEEQEETKVQSVEEVKKVDDKAVETEPETVDVVIPKVEADSDSDVPLVRHKSFLAKKKGEATKNDNDDPADDAEEIIPSKKEKSGARIKLESSSESDSDSETIKAVSERLKQQVKKDAVNKETSTSSAKIEKVLSKVGQSRSKDSSPAKPADQPIATQVKKPAFGDGTDFHPGWEEEVYKYKRSLRMPPGLIQVSRPPHWHRLSTSLPDLDPCPNSPAPSSADTSEFGPRLGLRIKQESMDSDVDSNSSFSFSLQKSAYDSEEGTSSSVILSNKRNSKCKNNDNNSILDRLVERIGSRKRRKRSKEPKGPKVIPKSENQLELLSTPSLKIPKEENKPVKQNNKYKAVIQKNDSMHLGFRKKTISNFKDAFLPKNGKEMIGLSEQFATVVMKSRTRTETRVLKQRATIREVFGEERPASAPPITCVEDSDLTGELQMHPRAQTDSKLKGKENTSTQAKSPTKNSLEDTKKALKNKIIQRGRKQNDSLLKVLAAKKINSECSDDESLKSETVKSEIKSETPSVDGEAEETEAVDQKDVVPAKRKYKLKNMRRKLSSGFDYIRKKKKIIKKELAEDGQESVQKMKRRGLIPRANPESVQDIQKEIKLWVMNKGVGETHLHRAARLGYTDVTAYCLEKMDIPASPKDNAGYTPLHEACARGHLDIARLLLLYGANVSESAQGGIRPLHEAAENGFVEIVRLLLSYGADATLATYTGLTPLSLATDDATIALLQNHLAEVQGRQVPPWHFQGPSNCFDPQNSGFDPLQSVPSPDPVSEDEDFDFETCEIQLPNLYILRGEPATDRWVLLQDLSLALKIKSKDALLRQVNPAGPSTSGAGPASNNYKNIFRELKMADFLEQARCCQFLCAGEKINSRASKIALVKYTDKVKQLLGVEKIIIPAEESTS